MPVTRRQSIHRDGEDKVEKKEELRICEDCSLHYLVYADKTESKLDKKRLKEWQDIEEKKTGIYPDLAEVLPFTCRLCEETKAVKFESTVVTGLLPMGNAIKLLGFLTWTLAIVVLLGSVYFGGSSILFEGGSILDTLKAKFLYSEQSFPVNMREQTPEEIKFESEIFKLEETYSKQEERVWLTLLAGIKSVVKSNPHQPSVFLMLYDDESGGRTAKCLAQDVSSTASEYMMKWSKEPLVITGVELKKPRLLDDPGLLLVDYNDTVRDRGAMIVTELQDVPPKVATSFHFFCDKFSPLVDKAIYFFTLKVDKLTNWKIQEKAENRLKELWSDEMAGHLLQPLITRMTPNVLKITSESSTC